MEAVGTVEDLFDREYDRLVAALGVAFDPESAADAVQEAFIEADKRWPSIGGYDDPAGWVRRVAIRRLQSGRRQLRRRAEILATLTIPDREDLTADLVDLERAIRALAPQQRITVCLVHLAGLSHDEVANALGVAMGTVKSNLHDAHRRLREALEATHG
jgi:RNA polymerase sigma-70 factor (ECF subfamily)